MRTWLRSYRNGADTVVTAYRHMPAFRRGDNGVRAMSHSHKSSVICVSSQVSKMVRSVLCKVRG